MKKRIISYLTVLIVSLTFFSSCKYNLAQVFYRPNEVWSRVKEITVLTPETTCASPDVGDDSVYKVLVVSDVHFGSKITHYDEKFYSWVEQQFENADDSQWPKFMICLGDIVEVGEEKYFLEYKAFTEKIEEIAATARGDNKFKVYTITGNHDLMDSGWQYFEKDIFPYTSCYKFTTQAKGSDKAFSWYFLDSGNGSLGRKQLKLFKEAAYSDPNPKIFCTHYPVYSDAPFYFILQNTDERDEILKICNDTKVKQIYGGHYHEYRHVDYGKFEENSLESYIDYQNVGIITVDSENESVTTEFVQFTKDLH